MALTGIEIFKLLPKTNCRECGFHTCLAFAMNLSAGKVDLSACPYVSEEAKEKLTRVESTPVEMVAIGGPGNPLKVGGESVIFRHEKRFNHPTGLAVLIDDSMDEATVDAKLQRFGKLRYRRMGINLQAELIAVKNELPDAEKFVRLIEKVIRNSDAKLILLSEDPQLMSVGLLHCAEAAPLIYAATPENAEQMAALAIQHSCPLAARADGLEALIDLSTRLVEAGVKQIVLDSGSRNLRQAFADQVHIRRSAVFDKFQPLRFPTIAFPCEMAANLAMETLIAAQFIAKYAGIVVLSDVQPESLFALLLQRMELFSDPQEPYKAPEGVHAIGEPDRNAPVLLTSAWALTYYQLVLAAEVSHTPVFLCVQRLEEPDVMCWCSHCTRSSQKGKFDAVATARFIQNCKLEERVDHRKLVICARNAQFSAELESALPEWEIVVGPGEAALLYGFLPEFAKNLR
jgi:acetyl-CoA decarbonylase/synthase complex subunit gamma